MTSEEHAIRILNKSDTLMPGTKHLMSEFRRNHAHGAYFTVLREGSYNSRNLLYSTGSWPIIPRLLVHRKSM
jgi:hypothetical protein